MSVLFIFYYILLFYILYRNAINWCALHFLYKCNKLVHFHQENFVFCRKQAAGNLRTVLKSRGLCISHYHISLPRGFVYHTVTFHYQ